MDVKLCLTSVVDTLVTLHAYCFLRLLGQNWVLVISICLIIDVRLRIFFFVTGKYTATMNAHLLSHIAECVRKWGPLWAYSCFSFEGMNRNLKILFHGTRDMSNEVL